MLLDFYQLKEQPFGVTPDPRFLYLGPSHREALASLCYGIKMGRGLVALVAPPGMGKTTLLFRLLQHLRQSARTAFLFQTQCDSKGLLHYLLGDLGINTRGQDIVGMHDQLNSLLVEEARAGRRFVVVIDEAQNLDENVLETARLLTDFETPSEKLLQIILAGQLQLVDKLKRPELVQLRQRISTVGRLQPLGLSEVNDYINYRLRIAGCSTMPLFAPSAVSKIASISEGVPRNINNLCFNALSLGYALGAAKIDADLVSEAATDLELGPSTTADPLPEQRRDVSAKKVAANGVETSATGRIELVDKKPTAPALRPARKVRPNDDDIATSEWRTCHIDEAPDGNDASELVLETLEMAIAQNAEILAEVIDGGWAGEAEQSTLPLSFSDVKEGELAAAPSRMEGAISFSGVDQERADKSSLDSPLVTASLAIAPKLSPLTISYSAERGPIGGRLAAIAALFVLSLAGFHYRLDIRAATTDLRQMVAAFHLSSRAGSAIDSSSAAPGQTQGAPVATTPSEPVGE
jgi:type II secretory pathway predicted ATPase ExeA